MAPPTAAPFHFHTGCPLTSRAMIPILQDVLLRCGYDTSKYNTHSLRIRAATAAAQAGLPPSTIQQLREVEQYCLHYLYPVPTDKSFRHSYGSISTMTTPLYTHTHTHTTHTHTHTHTHLYFHLYHHLEPNNQNQSIWRFHLGGTLRASALT